MTDSDRIAEITAEYATTQSPPAMPESLRRVIEEKINYALKCRPIIAVKTSEALMSEISAAYSKAMGVAAMTNTDSARIAEITAREQASTPGDWAALDTGPSGYGRSVVHPAGDSKCGTWMMAERIRRLADADFIAHSRSDIPWLLTKLSERDTRIADLENLVGELRAGRAKGVQEAFRREQSLAGDLGQCADELAFWKYQAIFGRAVMIDASVMSRALPEDAPAWLEAEEQLVAAYDLENDERALALANKHTGGAK